MKKQIVLRDFIPVGRENAVPMRVLSERLNIDARTLRALIQREREKGVPICSDWEKGGYFMPIDESEARAYCRQQQHRIKTASAALNGVRDYLKRGER